MTQVILTQNESNPINIQTQMFDPFFTYDRLTCARIQVNAIQNPILRQRITILFILTPFLSPETRSRRTRFTQRGPFPFIRPTRLTSRFLQLLTLRTLLLVFQQSFQRIKRFSTPHIEAFPDLTLLPMFDAYILFPTFMTENRSTFPV